MKSNSKDGVRAWVVSTCACFLMFIEIGVVKSLSVLLPHIREQFSQKTWVTGFAISLTPGFAAVTCFISAGLSKIWSPRQIIVACGFLSSFGLVVASVAADLNIMMLFLMLTGFSNGSVTVAVGVLSHYFEKHYNIALTMITCGASFGLIIMPLFTQYLIDQYGWRRAALLIGAMCFNSVVCGALFKPLQKERALLNVNSTKERNTSHESIWNSFDIRLFRNTSFTAMVFVAAGSGYYSTGWLIYAVPYALDVGFSVYKASAVATFGGVGNLIGNFSFPFLSQMVSNNNQLYTSLFFVSTSLAVTTVASSLDSYVGVVVCAIAYGFWRGVMATAWYAIVNDVVDEEGMVNAVGWSWATYGIMSILSGTISGWLYDHYGSYASSFIVLSLVCVITWIPKWFVDIGQLRRRLQYEPTS